MRDRRMRQTRDRNQVADEKERSRLRRRGIYMLISSHVLMKI